MLIKYLNGTWIEKILCGCVYVWVWVWVCVEGKEVLVS